MPESLTKTASLAFLASVATLLTACASGGSTSAATHSPLMQPFNSPTRQVPTEQPVPAESNPPGDIPDSTIFVPFRVDGGRILIKVPEAWARRASGATVTFTDKLNSVSLTWLAASSQPTAASARSQDVPKLKRTMRAFRLHDILVCAPSCSIPYSTAPIDVNLPSGRAVVITYDVNSAPNPVTGKQYRLEVLRFEFYRGGEVAALTLSGPVGSDNVDPWRLIAESFRWT